MQYGFLPWIMHDNIFRQERFFFSSWKRNLVVVVMTVLQQAHLGKAPYCWAISAKLPRAVVPLDGARASPGNVRLLNPLVQQAGTGLQAKAACWGKSRGETKNEHWAFKGDWTKSNHIWWHAAPVWGSLVPQGGVETTFCTRGKGHKLKQMYDIPSEHRKFSLWGWSNAGVSIPADIQNPARFKTPGQPHIGNSLSRGDGQSDLKTLSNIIHSVIVFLIHDFDNFTGHFAAITPFCRVTISIFHSHATFSPLTCSAFNESCRAQSLLISWGTQKPRDWLKDNQESGGRGTKCPKWHVPFPEQHVQVAFPWCTKHPVTAEGEGTGGSTDAALGLQIPAKERCSCVLPGSSGADSSAPLSSAEPQADKLVLEWNCIHDWWKQALPTTASSCTSGFCASHDLFFLFPVSQYQIWPRCSAQKPIPFFLIVQLLPILRDWCLWYHKNHFTKTDIAVILHLVVFWSIGKYHLKKKNSDLSYG